MATRERRIRLLSTRKNGTHLPGNASRKNVLLKPDAGGPHVRFDEGEVSGPRARPVIPWLPSLLDGFSVQPLKTEGRPARRSHSLAILFFRVLSRFSRVHLPGKMDGGGSLWETAPVCCDGCKPDFVFRALPRAD